MTFRKADIQLFREIVRGFPWEIALKDKGVQQS